MRIEEIAKIVHENNKVYCSVLGDHSHKSWEDSSDELKLSAIEGVEKVIMRGFISPDESHSNWLKDRVAKGWVYGKSKDLELKTHPCMVSYEDLPLQDKIKDRMFIDLVVALGVMIGE